MTPPDRTHSLLLPAWRALESALGDDDARAFFSAHVIEGAAFLSTLARERPASPLTSRPTTLGTLRHATQAPDRTWLVTHHQLRVTAPGQPARRIPLNYSSVILGPEGSRTDIEIPLRDATARLRFSWKSSAFCLFAEASGDVCVNRLPLTNGYTLVNGDDITIEDVQMRVFRILETPAELILVNGPHAGSRHVIDISEIRLGRFGRRDNDICLDDPTVSREHASIRYRDGRFWIEPESSVSPTAVNGQAVAEPRMLVDNDQIVLGEQALLFRVRGGARPKTLRSQMATVLFSDLRGWTPLAEIMPLQALIAQMDEYFKEMGEIITVHGGTLLTYQGDAVMAIFGAPSSHADDPWRAVSSAWHMQSHLRTLNARWEDDGRPALSAGIGLHTGLCVVGEMGHQSRLEYAAMGDTANLAARLEQRTRDLGCDVIMSQETFTQVSSRVQAVDLGDISLKGRSAPTRAYSLTGLRDEEAP